MCNYFSLGKWQKCFVWDFRNVPFCTNVMRRDSSTFVIATFWDFCSGKTTLIKGALQNTCLLLYTDVFLNNARVRVKVTQMASKLFPNIKEVK